MENEQMKKKEEEEVINLSEFDFSKEAAEKSSGEPAKESAQNSFDKLQKQRRSLGYYLSAITDALSGSDFSADEKKKRRNVIIVLVNFLIMFLVLGYYFYGNRTVNNNENIMTPAENVGSEMSPNNP